MTIAQILIILAAIVATGHGEELYWYTPRVEIAPLPGAPSGWKGATSCWPPVHSGVVYLNPQLPEDERLPVIVHELIHLSNNCHGAEWATELAVMDVLAYMGETGELERFISMKIEGCYDTLSLPGRIVEEYYCKPVKTMMVGDIAKYTYLVYYLERLGLR